MTHSHLRRISPAPMTDTERESEIARLSAEMEAAYAIWQSDGCFAARDDADRLMRQRDDLVRGRGAATAGAVEGGGVMRKEVIGDATLYLGDCLEILPTLPKVDAVITDPPYGLGEKMKGGTWGAKPEFKEMVVWDQAPPTADDLMRLASLSSVTVFWGGNYYGLPPTRCWLVWDKQNAVPTMADCELAWTSLDANTKRLSRPVGRVEHGHPSEKPLDLMAWTLRTVKVSGTVLDPYMGSGTTGVACVQAGLPFIGIEREPKYFDIAVRRIEQAYKQRPLFEAEPPKQPQQLEIGA